MRQSHRLRAPLASVFALALLVPLAACASGSSADAPTGESLVIYSGRSEELVGPLFEEFTQQTGIPVQARFGDSAELAAQMLEEGDRTPAQVFFSQDAGSLGAVAAAGLLAALPTTVAESVPLAYRSGDGTWTGVTGRSRVIVFDAQQVSAEAVPTSVLDLVDPKWKGQVAIAPTNASFQAFVTAMRRSEGDQATEQWLAGLVANEVQAYEKNSLILDAVDAGQVQLGLINHYYWFEKAAEVGSDAMRAQIAFTKPEDAGSLVNVAGVGITAGAAGNPAAEQFVTWLLTPQVQQWFGDNTYEYPLASGVDPADGLPLLSELKGPDVGLADLADLPGTLEMLARVGLL